MAKTVFDVLKEKLEADKASAQNFLGGGGAKDFSQYKEATGLIRGLEAGLSYIEDLSRNYMEGDDD
jgi:tripartite-type tricarboxylate transporter receptor subunit TctC